MRRMKEAEEESAGQTGGKAGLGGGLCRFPVLGQQDGEVVGVFHGWEAGEQVTQVVEGGFAVAAAGEDEGVDDGGALAGLWVADEEPVLFADGGGADGVLDGVVVGFGVAVCECISQD